MSRSDRFDRGDFGARYHLPAANADEKVTLYSAAADSQPSSVVNLIHSSSSQRASWPIARTRLQRVGQSVLTDRNGKGRPHKGIDLFAPAGTPVLSAQRGRVLRVVDGRTATSASQRRAGLFIDVLGQDALVYRYLHLGEVRVKSGQMVSQGSLLGNVAAAHTSGLADNPHLHFEIRLADVNHAKKDYGTSIDPLRLLPPLRV